MIDLKELRKEIIIVLESFINLEEVHIERDKEDIHVLHITVKGDF